MGDIMENKDLETLKKELKAAEEQCLKRLDNLMKLVSDTTDSRISRMEKMLEQIETK